MPWLKARTFFSVLGRLGLRGVSGEGEKREDVRRRLGNLREGVKGRGEQSMHERLDTPKSCKKRHCRLQGISAFELATRKGLPPEPMLVVWKKAKE